jgi:hypothetical protein
MNRQTWNDFKFPCAGTIVGVSSIILILLLSCRPTPTPVPTPTPTPTRPIGLSTNKNVKALNAVQAALNDLEFGFAPLLVQDETRVLIETKPEGEVARLVYPLQPADPAVWSTVDSFILACAVRNVLLDFPQVEHVALGSFDLSAPVDDLGDLVNHVAVWVTFTDYTQAIVDLSPLATNFAAQHEAESLIYAPSAIEEQFAIWRQGVFLNQLQPMKVVTEDGETYYLLAQVLVFYDHYEFSLRVHPVQTADPMRPLRLMPGALVSLEVDREDFEAMQELIAAEGPNVFRQRPELLTRQGNNNQTLDVILDEHFYLLWHLVTKMEHRLPDPDFIPTPTPTFTPTPTPTPTPTATPANPLLIS